MGCDYYILKLLQIYMINDTNHLEIVLERERGYFGYEEFDEDADDYEESIKAYIATVLTPKMKPIIIYENGRFRKEICELKYKSLIEKEISDWSSIERIVKVEKRYER